MTIREVEELVGMTRANIRFYEKEELLFPKRDPNGYRDYTPEDVETLRKIKLLRQLKLPVEAIRQVQRGERTLDSAIQSQEAQLEKEQRDLEWAGEICHALRAEHASYATLDAKRYLERLDRSPDAPGYFNLKEDEAPTVSHPWRRYFARVVDTGLYDLLWTAVRLLLLRWNSNGFLMTLLDSYITFGLMLVIEPVLLCTWGCTPGKWIFGLRVRTLKGEKLSFGTAWLRTFGVFSRGFGWGVPIYNIVRLVKCCKACSNGEPMDWEWENGEEAYTIRDTKTWRCAAFVAADAAVIGLAVLLTLQAYMPVHRGTLTPEQYADNINDMVSFQHLSLNGMNKSMDENGRWVNGVQPAVGHTGYFSLASSLPPHYMTIEDGVVTGVRIELEGAQDGIISAATVQKQLAALALVAAQREYNCVSWAASGVLKAIEKNCFDNYTLQAGGMTIQQECTWTGYQVIGDCLFAGNEAENLSYHLVFTIEATNG